MSNKVNSVLALGALCLSAAALVVSLRKSPPEEINRAVEKELDRRERLYVEKNREKMTASLEEYLAIKGIKDWHPQTIHELYEPLMEIIAMMGAVDDTPTPDGSGESLPAPK